MPNYCWTKIYTDTETIQHVKKLVCNENEKFDFNALIPMPKELDIESSSIGDVGLVVYVAKKINNGIIDNNLLKYIAEKENRDIYFFDNPERIKHSFATWDDETCERALKIGKRYSENIEKFGCRTWYEWCIKNWGTKWNSFDVDWNEDGGCVSITTAWSAPMPVLKALSMAFPNSTFDIESEYEGECELRGCTIEAGRVFNEFTWGKEEDEDE